MALLGLGVGPPSVDSGRVKLMKATNLLKRQHRQTEKLMKQLQRSKEEGERTEILTQLADGLAAHMMIEEQIFYPAVRDVLTGKKEVLGDAALLEHQMGKIALQNLLADGATSFEARLKVLKELVEHHVAEEEEQMFPEVEARMEEVALKELGAQMQELHEQAVAMGHQKMMEQAMAAEDTKGGAAQSMQAKPSGGSSAGTKARANGHNGHSRATTKQGASGRAHARA